ncbi:MAG: hypothetical protein UY72_C0038G0002 [Candidatus Uhrbacteria bacterium GW2011_GWD2_52_7]|uniref:Uncharacterized protein n=1 Tax=Candidatus Uhrbacteria bacterium GW2011_GWD2_52_7 TaxID=1618989 RepID=A0A0G1XFE6_9BACT|nr:MAG: hypothetical protein UY72_C0038G0002 [Candidatus Uhrbacteria bacterium GW2011_GWD2_52_7]
MRRFIVFAVALSLFLPRFAWASDAYADSLYTYTPQDLYNPTNVIGAPDGLFADYGESGTYLIVDMGEGEESAEDLLLTVSVFDIGARATLTFYGEDWDTLAYTGDYIPTDSSTWTVEYSGVSAYRYVRIESTTNKEWSLDAVEAEPVSEPAAETEEPAEPTDEEPTEESAELEGGTLIKSDEFSAVYLLGSDDKRHAFPNETVFFSWGYSFDDVVTLFAEDLAGYTLGRNVTIKPASYLVKLPTNPKVYAVAPDATLRWVTSESVAVSLYGTDWANDVVDVADVFWGNYSVGEDIDESSDAEGWEVSEHAF